MSLNCTSAVWGNSTQRGTRLLIQLAIADHADEYGVAWPSVETLAQRARITRRMCLRHLAMMEARRDILIFRREGQFNHYIVPTGLTQEQFVAGIKRLAAHARVPVDAVIEHLLPVNPGTRVKTSEPVNSSTRVGEPEPVNPSTPTREPQYTGTREPQYTPPVYSGTPDPSLNHHSDPPDDPPVIADGNSEPEKSGAVIAAESPAPTPAPEPTPDPPTPKPPTPHQAMFQAICDSQGWDTDKLTPENKSAIGKLASSLRKAECEPGHVAGLWAHCQKVAIEKKLSGITMHYMNTQWPDYWKLIKPRKKMIVPVPDWARQIEEGRQAAFGENASALLAGGDV